MATPQAALAVLEVDKAMHAWFSQSIPISERKPFNEGDFRDISNALRSTGRETWSRVPRLYATLRSINQLPLIDVFLAQGLSDLWFPFSHKTLPESVRSQTARNDFIEAQRLVLTKSLDLEKEDGKHRHFLKQDDIPMVKISELGRGGFGVVEKVISTISYKEYARKLIPRGPTFRKNREVLRDFEMELATLKKLSHIHIVELVGSYTDPRYVGILTSPVADCNLKDYLERPLSEGMNSLLRTSFGCLVAAVNYLHQNRIRHKDIKPQNILIKDHQVLVTDFGISRDWSDYGQSTTTGPTIKTPKYCAPEVAASKPRNSLADIWSLGCVFLEIWTVLCGESVNILETHLITHGSKSKCYHDNSVSVRSWCETLVSQIQDPGLKPPEAWIRIMLEFNQDDRCNAQILFDMIQDHSLGPDTRYSFVGLCCTEQEDTEESVLDSDYEPDLNLTTTEATTVSSAMSHDSLETGELVQHSNATNQLLVEDVSSAAVTPPADLLALEQLSLRGSEQSPTPIEPELNKSPPNQSLQLPTIPPANMNSSVTELKPGRVSTPLARSNSASPAPDLTPHYPETLAAAPSNLLNNSSSHVASVPPVTLKVLMEGSTKKFEVSYLQLQSWLFFETLRNILFIPSGEPITVRRWSDSGVTWMILDPKDQPTWKQMLRAARAKLKLRLRVDIVQTTNVEPDSLGIDKENQLPIDSTKKAPPNDLNGDYFSQDPSQAPRLVQVKLRFGQSVKKFTVPLDDVHDPPTLFSSLCSRLDLPNSEGLIFERFSDTANAYMSLGPDPIATSSEYRTLIRAAKSKMKLRLRVFFAQNQPLHMSDIFKPNNALRAPPSSPDLSPL